MTFNPKTKQFQLAPDKIEYAALRLMHAIKHIRLLAGLSLEPYQQQGQLTNADHAMKSIIDAAKLLGIDFGVDWGEELDVRSGEEKSSDRPTPVQTFSDRPTPGLTW